MENNEITLTNENVNKPKNAFCVHCGCEIFDNKEYCPRCGMSKTDRNVKHCIVCGNPISEGQKFCPKCGTGLENSPNIEQTAKKRSIKPFIFLGIGALLTLIIAVSSIIVLPKLLVSTEEYLEQGNYIKAYQKAKKEEKNDVLFENLIASICAESKSDLKDEDSFKLREVYFDEENNRIVLRIQGANSYGGEVSSYWYYTFDEEDGEYTLWTTVSDFDDETIYSWDDFEERLEKILKNSAKEIVKGIINDHSNKRGSDIVKRINNLNELGILSDVELLDDVSALYPTSEDKVY